MKVWTTSDLHIDYPENFKWFLNLSAVDYTDDFLIIAGDITDELHKMQVLFKSLVPKFRKIFFLPGNHDLWLHKNDAQDSMEKFHMVNQLAKDEGLQTQPYLSDELSIIPLYSWYDFTFGNPSKIIRRAWRDFKRCKWTMDFPELTHCFHQMNEEYLSTKSKEIISFSHFLPSVSMMPKDIPKIVKSLFPVFGSEKLGEQLKLLTPGMHIYGHNHLNRSFVKERTCYINNAFGYPKEKNICRKALLCVYDNGVLNRSVPQWPEYREL